MAHVAEGNSEATTPGSELSRRNFFLRSIGAVGGLIGAIIAVPAVGFLLSPLLEKHKKAGWIAVGPVTAFPEGDPTLASIVTDDSAEMPFKQGVYVVNHGGGNFDIFRLNCTHLGCPYEWNAAAQKFFCPCHGGVFDISGNVMAGPPPRPLDRYKPLIKQGVLYAGELLLGGKQPVA